MMPVPAAVAGALSRGGLAGFCCGDAVAVRQSARVRAEKGAAIDMARQYVCVTALFQAHCVTEDRVTQREPRSSMPMPIERVIGTIRRECVDFMIPLNEQHLRRILLKTFTLAAAARFACSLWSHWSGKEANT
jgi:hypothetical protein